MLGKRSSVGCGFELPTIKQLSPAQRTSHDRLRWVFGAKAVKFYMDPRQLTVKSTGFICRAHERPMSILSLLENRGNLS